MRRMTSTLIATLLLLATGAGGVLAHHDGMGELPDNNPHSSGVPDFLWDVGTDAFFVIDDSGEMTDVPVVLNDDPLEFEQQNYWFLFRVGDGDEAQYVASRFDNGLPTGDVQWQTDGDFGPGDFVNSMTGEPVTQDDYVYFQYFPHEHHIVLHPGTDQERCIDIAGGKSQNQPNQHNNMHIGAPSQHTPGGFQNAGHEIHFFSCEDAYHE